MFFLSERSFSVQMSPISGLHVGHLVPHPGLTRCFAQKPLLATSWREVGFRWIGELISLSLTTGHTGYLNAKKIVLAPHVEKKLALHPHHRWSMVNLCPQEDMSCFHSQLPETMCLRPWFPLLFPFLHLFILVTSVCVWFLFFFNVIAYNI